MTYRVAQSRELVLLERSLQREGRASHWQSGLCLPACSKLFFEIFIVQFDPSLPLSNYTQPIPTQHHIYFSHNTAKMSDQGDEISQVTYEQLAGIEDEFEEIDTQISTSSHLSHPHHLRQPN
jgi:hypothetical protein